IYMRQPPGYSAPNSDCFNPYSVFRSRQTLYGLKQSGRRWYQKLVEILVGSMGFRRCDVDQAVFYRHDDGGKLLMIVLVHVDDCTIAATQMEQIIIFKARIAEFVEISDLGELHWLLGIDVQREREHRIIQLTQQSYIDMIIRVHGFE